MEGIWRQFKFPSEHLNSKEFSLPDLWFLQKKISNHVLLNLTPNFYYLVKTQLSFYQAIQNYSLCSSLWVSLIWLTRRELPLTTVAGSHSCTCQLDSKWVVEFQWVSIQSLFQTAGFALECNKEFSWSRSILIKFECDVSYFAVVQMECFWSLWKFACSYTCSPEWELSLISIKVWYLLLGRSAVLLIAKLSNM